MKVILEAQHAVGRAELRGIGHYSLCLLRALLKRKLFDYELTYFDYNQEMQNYLRAEELFSEFNVPMHECTDLDYRIASRYSYVFENKSYNEYTNAYGDVFHFTNFFSIPTRLTGKSVVTVHDLNHIEYPEVVPSRIMQLLNVGIERLEYLKPIVIADSNSAKNEMLQYTSIPEENIRVVYQSYDEEMMYPDKTESTDILAKLGIFGDYIFYVGAIERKKNIERIVKAFDIIATSFSDLKLVLAGKPTWDDPTALFDRINKSSFKDRIIMPGYVDVDVKRILYSNAVCFIFPSLCEGFGIPVLEAMACGCPVVTSDNTSLPEVAGDAAIMVNAYDVDQLALAIERILSSESLRKDMSTKGLAQSRKFSWEKTAEQVEQIYEFAYRS